jgi:hypothetical protein
MRGVLTIRRRGKTGPVCLYIPKGEHRDLTEAEKAVSLAQFSDWLAGRELHQANADEAAAIRKETGPLLLAQYMIDNGNRRTKGHAMRKRWELT